MKTLVLSGAAILLAASLLGGCGRKKAEVAQEPDPSLTAGEPMSEDGSGSGAGAEGSLSDAAGGSGRERQSESSDVALAGLPADLLASDQAYDVWFKKHKLDLADAAMLDADPDGDGASNRDEFMADTNPRDPNSRPGIHRFIRLKEYHEVKIPLMLESVEGESARIRQLG